MMTFPTRCLLLTALFAAPVAAHAGSLRDFFLGKRDIEVITNTELTPVGRKWPAASKDAPQYYIAISAGFRDFGGAIAGITEPPSQDVIKALSAALAKRGYLPATDQSPAPTLALFFTWGTLNADDVGFDASLPTQVRNRQQILRFLGAKSHQVDDTFLHPFTAPAAGLTVLSADARELYEVSEEDFYVAVVSAYDLASVQRKQRELLWTTRIASFGRGFDFPDVYPTMAAIGGAEFGRETQKPVWIRASEKYQPDIKLGEIQVVEHLQGAQLPVVDASAAANKKSGNEPPAAPEKR